MGTVAESERDHRNEALVTSWSTVLLLRSVYRSVYSMVGLKQLQLIGNWRVHVIQRLTWGGVGGESLWKRFSGSLCSHWRAWEQDSVIPGAQHLVYDFRPSWVTSWYVLLRLVTLLFTC